MLDKLILKYENPWIKALIQIVISGPGSVIDTALTARIKEINSKRARIFFDQLNSGEIELTEELIKSEDFLHAFFSTFSAAQRTRREEKIQLFGNLLRNSLTNKLINKTDEYEEYLKVLDELTYREIILLRLLESYERKYPHNPGQNDAKRANRFWSEFIVEARNIFHTNNDEIDSMLIRLTRTGCYDTFAGKYWQDADHNIGKLTIVYYGLIELIKDKNI